MWHYIKLFLIALSLLTPLWLTAQQAAGIEEIMELASRHYPSSDAEGLYESSMKASLAAERAALRPMVSLGGQATWQSDVTAVDIGFPSDLPFTIDLDIPSPKKDAYKLTLDVAQRIYQGGAIKAQERAQVIDHSILLEELRAGASQWKQQAAECFYTIRLLEVSRQLTSAYIEDLNSRLAVVESGIRHGMLDQASGDIIKAELLNLQQKVTEQSAAIAANRDYLAILTGDSSFRERQLLPSPLNTDTNTVIDRPELRIISLHADRLATASRLLDAYKLPAVSGFGQAGYGRPGLNMLDDQFASFAIVGVRLNWNLWDNRMKRNRQDALRLQQQIAAMQQESVRENLSGRLKLCTEEIRKFERLIVQDEEHIKLRVSISKAYSSQFENGVINAAEYIRQKNEEVRASLNLEAHRIGLEKARTTFLFASGKW